MSKSSIPFIDLQAQRKKLGDRIKNAIGRVMDHGCYIMGPEVFELESALSKFCDTRSTITCSSGTDALALILMAKGIKEGDAILVPSFTFAATAEVVAWVGATPIFVDVLPDTYNMDPNSLEYGIAIAKEQGLKPKAAIVVDLFGQPADYDAIESICEKQGLWLLSDAAQSFGASYKERKVGSIGLATATSFFPAKPLGCYGDGGAIFTDDDELAEVIRSLRVHGQGTDKYDNVRIGMNGRIDTLQAAILLEKMNIFEEEILARQRIAEYYNEKLKEVVQVPILSNGVSSAWAQYSILLKESINRKELVEDLKTEGIPTAIYYPKPLHRQTAYRKFPSVKQETWVSDILANRILSLPMHPYLAMDQQSYIIDALITLIGKQA